MSMYKRSKIIILATIVMIFILFIAAIFKYDEKLKVMSNGTQITCFSGKILNFNIYWLKNGLHFWDVKLLGISKEDFNTAGALKSEKDNYIIFISKNTLKYYSIKERNLQTYTLKKDEAIISTSISDIDNDNNNELLIIVGEGNEGFGEKLVILEISQKTKEIFKISLKDMKPWKVQVADVDGDNKKEISIGVYKESEFHPVKAKRPFIYNWHGDGISPKWRGSRLARPFEDYIFADIDKDGLDEIISIEVLGNGKKVINSYKWKGFGFQGMAESKEYLDILSIDKIKLEGSKDNIIIKIKNREKYEWVLLHYIDEKLKVKSKVEEYIPVVSID